MGDQELSPEMAARDLLRHIKPDKTEDRLYDIIQLNPALTEELLATVDVPLKVGTDSQKQEFILCDYNRDGDSYRSPYTNEYYPPLPDGIKPPQQLRELEIMGNRGFQAYLKQYYNTGVLSVYAWEIDQNSFGVGVFVNKSTDEANFSGTISNCDVCQITKTAESEYIYSLVSSAIVDLRAKPRIGEVHLSGNVNDQHEKKAFAMSPLDHLVTIGTMIEDNAADFVQKIRSFYVSKSKEILSYTKRGETISPSAKREIEGKVAKELKQKA